MSRGRPASINRLWREHMNTSTTASPSVAGIYELAREHLTTLCDEFLDGDPVRIVSAWRCAGRMDPDDLADTYEGPYGLRLRVINDIGSERAEAGCCERDCYEAFAALRLAYGKDCRSRRTGCRASTALPHALSLSALESTLRRRRPW